MKSLERVNDSVLGRWERPTLLWLAERIPVKVVPDHLTAFGVLGALLSATGYVLSRGSLLWLWLACAGLWINWFGDSLDGTLARLRRIERPRYGFFIDHTCDLFCQSTTFLALGVSPLAHFGVACLGLITFLMAFVYTLITAHARATMRITYFFFGPTEIRALLFLGNALVLVVGVVDLRTWLPGLSRFGVISIHDLVISLLSVAGVTVLALLAVADGRAVALEDPPPLPAPRPQDSPHAPR
jgi:archaetidylinositol phosphate synthase